MKKIIAALLLGLGLLQGAASAAEGGIAWDRFPTQKLTDNGALQNGARLFVNYCLNCHAAAYMRYNRLNDIGLTDRQIENSLLFTDNKVGETMKVAVDPRMAKDWFGAVPPDLTVIARSRSGSGGSGADYLYTYLRSYYRDDSKPTGWNNLAYPNVGMPHVMWELQGQRRAVFEPRKDPHAPGGSVQVFKRFEQITPGSMSQPEYDEAVADLVAFMQWMSEPSQLQRIRLGVWVLVFLAAFTFIAWRLNAAYWKDVK